MFLFQPQFLDIFGLIAFIYIVYFAIRGLFGKKVLWGLFGRTVPNWMLIVLLLVGLLGLTVDSLMVYTFYLK